MEFKEALKKVQTKKPKENYLVFTLGYDNKIILPHKDGIALMCALASAEQLHTPYNEKHKITELTRTSINVDQMSQEEYERYKIAALLDISLDEVKQYQLQAT